MKLFNDKELKDYLEIEALNIHSHYYSQQEKEDVEQVKKFVRENNDLVKSVINKLCDKNKDLSSILLYYTLFWTGFYFAMKFSSGAKVRKDIVQ